MKSYRIFSLGMLLATSVATALAAVPTVVTLDGEAVDETAAVTCTKTSDGCFEAFVKLLSGKSMTITGDDGTHYTVSNSTLAEGTSSTPVTKDGVYCVSLDFTANSAAITEVNSLGFYFCWDGKSIADLSYVGNGRWSGGVELPSKDDRYKFVMTLGGKTVYWGPTTSGLDKKPSELSLGDAYYNMQRSTPSDQWAEKWKFEDSQKGTTKMVTVTLRGDVYTHVFTEVDATPTAISATGTALAEGGSVTFTQINNFTFECFTTLKSGSLTVTDGTYNYDITGSTISKTSGSTTLDKSEGIYCINLDFANNLATIKEVTSLGFYFCWDGKSIADLSYAGNGRWSGGVELPSKDDRYKFVMTLDGQTVYWGPTTAGLDKKPSQLSLGDAYYNMQRSTPADQWAEKWKFEDGQKGTTQVVTVTLAGDAYTHGFTEATTTPTAVSATGSALAENGSVTFTRINSFTFECFTTLKSGSLTVTDGTNNYDITGGTISKTSGSTTVDKSEGIYCINLDFANSVATIKEVTSLGVYYCWDGKSIADMSYRGDGQWGVTFNCPTSDDRYKFVMELDGQTVYWGPTTAGLDKRPSELSLGDAYYYMQRSTPADQWAEKWKFESDLKGVKVAVLATLSGEQYTHSFTVYDPTTGVEEVAGEAYRAVVTVRGSEVTLGVDATIYAVAGVKVAQGVAGETLTLGRGLYVAAGDGRAVKFVVE